MTGSSNPVLCDNVAGGVGWEMGRKLKREGTCEHLWLIHADVWQKPTQYCKAILLQLKMNENFKNWSTLKKKS